MSSTGAYGAGTGAWGLVLEPGGWYWGLGAGTGIRELVPGYGGWYWGQCLLGEAADCD